MKKEINLILDFDSTIVELETIEVLADFSLKKNPEKNKIYNKIKDMTNLAMSGKLSFAKALSKRISLLEANKTDVNKTINFLKEKVSYSFIKNLSYFNKYNKNCFIVSGGFKEIIIPVLENFNFIEKNIYANTFNFNQKNEIVSIDKNNPLSKDKGKNLIIKNLKGYNIIVGDGYTDYEVKKYGNADLFIQFTGNINRSELNQNADFISTDFSEIIEFIHNV